jgi:cytochrome P450
MKKTTTVKYALLENVVQPVAIRALTTVEKLRTGVAYNPLDRRYQTDPYPLFRELRERDPFHRSRLIGGWVLTRHEDVSAVLKDSRFMADDTKLPFQTKQRQQLIKDGVMGPDEALSPGMLRSDPPDHTRLRSLVSKAFTPRTIESLRPRIEAIVQDLLDRAPADSMDVIRELAYPLPVIVIAEMLGIPAEDREQFKRWSDDAVASFGVTRVSDFLVSRKAFSELQAYFARVSEERRREPREDLLSALLAAEQEGDKLTLDEVYTTCILLLVAGNETTTNLIGNGLLALLRQPEQLALLRDDPALIESAVEELLRYDSPVQATSRFVLEDVALGANTVAAGQQVIALIGAANRDPEAFTEPERLDITRTDNRHLAFGHGIHYCLGAPLARLETQVALPALLDRFPELRLAGEPQWGKNLILRGLTSLPISC